ncbi:acyl-protein thioesterase 2-like protein [Tanacetum coccineum]|uniref:Acyl-protein thioesterase 2-like protein n=1 Tax=Tanacetum coccineum TaxID=301880 RepID=A0ABQ4WGQ8_9ASTR
MRIRKEKLMMLQKLSMVCKLVQLLETLPLPNIKWICPTSPSQPLTLFSGFPSNAWFDVSSDLSEDAKHDVAGLDASAAHVLSLLSTEPKDVVGLSGWLPCAKELVNKVEGDEAAARASSLPILLFLKADWRHQLHQTPYVFVKLFKGSDDNET